MIFTDYVREHMMENSSVFNEKDWKHIDEVGFRDIGLSLKGIFDDVQNTTMFFNKGFISFKMEWMNGDGYNNDKVCYIYFIYKEEGSPLTSDWDEFINQFKLFCKANKCTKILMHTELKTDFWIKRYGFKIKKYEMELDL